VIDIGFSIPVASLWPAEEQGAAATPTPESPVSPTPSFRLYLV